MIGVEGMKLLDVDEMEDEMMEMVPMLITFCTFLT